MPNESSREESERYRRSWHSYVARRNLMVALFLSFSLVGVLVARLKLGEGIDFAILAGWVAVYLLGAWWLTLWTCPRCGKRFGDRLWTPRCRSCGLEKEEIAAVAHHHGPKASGA